MYFGSDDDYRPKFWKNPFRWFLYRQEMKLLRSGHPFFAAYARPLAIMNVITATVVTACFLVSGWMMLDWLFIPD